MGDCLNVPAEIALQKKQYLKWLESERESSRINIDLARKMLPIAIRDCLTEKQKVYIVAYIAEELTMQQIAKKYGVNKATVSRTISRGLNNLYDHLRFVSPYFVEESMRQTMNLNRKTGYKFKNVKKRRNSDEKRAL